MNDGTAQQVTEKGKRRSRPPVIVWLWPAEAQVGNTGQRTRRLEVRYPAACSPRSASSGICPSGRIATSCA